MLSVYFGLIIGEIVLFDLMGEDLVSMTPMNFLGWQVPTRFVTIIGGLILLMIGVLGSLNSLIMIAKFLLKKPFQLTWKPKIGVLTILILLIIGVQFYVPFWPVLFKMYTPSFGPYIAIYDQNTMEISWDTPNPVEHTLYWGSTAEHLNNALVGRAMYNSSQTLSKHHMVLISGLTPGETYYYQIPGFTQTVYHFRMAPLAGTHEKVTFTVAADVHAGSDANVIRKNINLMLRTSPDLAFTTIAGDLCSKDDDPYLWAGIFDRQGYGKLASSIPWMNTGGNHETYNYDSSVPRRYYYKNYFQYNYAGNRTIQPGLQDYGLYYSFNYSDVHMIILDNMESESDYFSAAQIQWLHEDLARNTNMWKFVAFHFPMYSTGQPTSDTKLDAILEPIFNQYHVDGVFWGHAHNFESFYRNGTYYFTVGTGGGNLDPLLDTDHYRWPSNHFRVSETTDGTFETIYGHEYQLYGELTHGFLQVTVQDNTCTFSMYRTDGTIAVQYNLTH